MTEKQVVLVTGATGKLGRTFVLGFAGLGFDVILTTRRAAAAEVLRQECLESGAARAECIEVDLKSADAASIITQRLANDGLSPTVLVNNARDVSNLRPELDGRVSRANWQNEFSLGVIAPYELTLAVASMPDSRLQSVVNVASIYGITAPNLGLYDDPGQQSPVNYGVVKAALIHLTKELAVRMAARNIRVNAVSYGGVEGRVSDAFRDRYAKLCPTGRMLNDSQVLGAVKFLACEDSSGMTGHNLVVDGGWTVW